MSLLDELNNTSGETITFYSYKGGNGRTMALSNVATLLCQQNPKDKILMIDWDLEAPGLHRFFFQDSLFNSLTNKDIKQLYRDVDEKPGLIDMFMTLNKSISEYDVIDDTIVSQVLNQIKINDYIIPTSLNNLYMLKAGRFDEYYSDKVNTFNWERLYDKAPSLIRLFSEELTKRYKYVLIDSRTGFTDISGICTMLLPQKLVLVFTPNRQSYTGIKNLIIKATTYRRQSDDIRPLLVYPLPSRIEFSRDDLRAYWRDGNDEMGITGYQVMFQDIFKEVYGLEECNLKEYFEQVQIQQSPNYAYGEEIAVLSEKTKDSFSLSKSYEIFTHWLVDSIAPWQSEKSDESSNVDTGAATDFDDIGLEYEKKGQYEKALSYYNRSLVIYGELADKKGLARIHNKIGTLLSNMQRFDEALQHYEKALEIHRAIEDHFNMARDSTSIGLIYEQRSEHEDSLKWYNEALRIDPNFVEALNAKNFLMKNHIEKKPAFISYVSEDKEVARSLYNNLKKYGIDSWLDEDFFLVGQRWQSKLKEAIKNCHYFIPLLSKNSTEQTGYLQKELSDNIRIFDELQNSQTNIVPVRLDDSQISEPTIQEAHIVDLFPDWNKGFQKILLAMKIEEKPDILSKQDWENLLYAMDKKNCIPIIGEGALEFINQIDYHAPITKQELAKQLVAEYNYPLEGPYELPKVAQFITIDQANETSSKQVISSKLKEVHIPDFKNKYKNSLHALLGELDLPIYITTNYDLFMEEALKSQGKEPVSEFCRWNDDLMDQTESGSLPSTFDKKYKYRPTPNKPLVFHIFGSIEYPTSMVLTERDHFDFAINTNREEAYSIPSFLKKELVNSSLIFIGYNLDDIDFRSIMQGSLNFLNNIPKTRSSLSVLSSIDTEDDFSKKRISKYLEKYTANMFRLNIYWGTMAEFAQELQ